MAGKKGRGVKIEHRERTERRGNRGPGGVRGGTTETATKLNGRKGQENGRN